MAVALGNLYHEEMHVTPDDVVGVLAAAHALKFYVLQRTCADIMMKTLNKHTVCVYHTAASKVGGC